MGSTSPDDVLAFIGVWTDAPFDRIEIIDTTATIDNEYFGKFYTGTVAIPIPATVWLFTCALVTFFVKRAKEMQRF